MDVSSWLALGSNDRILPHIVYLQSSITWEVILIQVLLTTKRLTQISRLKRNNCLLCRQLQFARCDNFNSWLSVSINSKFSPRVWFWTVSSVSPTHTGYLSITAYEYIVLICNGYRCSAVQDSSSYEKQHLRQSYRVWLQAEGTGQLVVCPRWSSR